ncbi:MAG TPA: penicillin-binding protein activator [Sandaracinaceae bacterium LLY-WYZ-13_1]|nr:penicillin-binding protein activator [Sandaracinaceae bacterium LLY-WYZ-13_1]
MRRALFVGICFAVLGTGCPRGAGQEDLSSLPQLTTEDPEAEADLRRAREAAEAGEPREARGRFEAFLTDHPDDPLVPLAQLGLGQVLLAEGDLPGALERFGAVARSDDASVAEAGRFYQGVALHLAGRSEDAIERLRPLVGRTTDPEETALLLRTLSAAARRTGRAVLALEALDRLARDEDQPEAERDEARGAIRALVAEAEAEDVDRAYGELARDGVAWPEVAVRAIRLAFDAGDMERVGAIVAELREHEIPMSDELAELAVRAERTGRADPRVIGAIVPLTGPGREVGQRAVRGLMLASGSPPDGPPGPDTPQLVLRDDGGDPARAGQAVEDLVSEHRAIAIVGPLEGAAAREAAQRAQALGVPLIALVPDPRVTAAGEMVFRLFASPDDEAAALVRAARARGARRFAVLRPEHAYGEAMSQAFAAAVREAGGELVATETYEAGATAFGAPIERLERASFDALFVPDAARQLNLIAPALAAAGLWSVPADGSAPRGNRGITLLAPSVALEPRVIRGSSRYLQGALFATPFDPSTAAGAGRAFVDEFTGRFGTAPDAFSAYAYDAFRLVRRAVEAGETTRGGVAEWLRQQGRHETVGASGGLTPERGPARRSRVLELRDDVLTPVGTAPDAS